MSNANTITAFGVYLSVTFAYLVTVWFVGPRLSAFQAIFVSVLFCFGAIGTMGGVVLSLYQAAVYRNASGALVDPLGAAFWSQYMVVLLSLGVIGSLYFMWDVRHSKSA